MGWNEGPLHQVLSLFYIHISVIRCTRGFKGILEYQGVAGIHEMYFGFRCNSRRFGGTPGLGTEDSFL